MNKAAFLLVLITLLNFNNTIAQKKTLDPINKFMVIGLLGNVENRQTLEEEITIDLQLKGINAMPSYKTNLTSSDKITKEMVIKVCENNNVDGIVLIEIVNRSESSGYTSRRYQQYGEYYYWGVFAFYYGPGYEVVSTSAVSVHSTVITVPEGKVVYDHDTQINVGGDVEKIIGKFSDKLTKKIAKKGIALIKE